MTKDELLELAKRRGIEVAKSADKEELVRVIQGSPPASDVRVSHGVPPMEIEVAEDATIVHEGKEYVGGKKLTVDGPMAQNLELQGQAKILRSVPE